MNVIGIFTNEQKDPGFQLTRRICDTLSARNIEYCFDESLMGRLSGPEIGDLSPELIIVLGGDGTMLSAARKYASMGIPLLGLNLGRMGFLLDTEFSEFEAAIDAMLCGEYTVEERLMLEASIYSAETGEVKYSEYALNEAVVSQKNIQRLIHVDLSVNGNSIDRMHCDGLIVSTPTGSTGYSLSAGGSIVMPDLGVMLITPVCSHSLTSFKMVISEKDVVEIVPKKGSAALTLDGQVYRDIDEDDRVVIRSAGFKARFARYTNKDFFTVLKDKFTEWNIKQRFSDEK